MMLRRKIAVVFSTIAVVGLTACGSADSTETKPPPSVGASSPESPAPAAAHRVSDSGPRIVALGDSLTAGLGLDPNEAYPALLQQRLNDAGLKYLVVNGGVSGDTSAGGLRRLDWALEGDVRVLIVALGGNDALRGLPVAELRRNLSNIIERAQSKRIDVILAGMEAPPNFGQDYTVEFRRIYADLARRYTVSFVPFLLDGVAGIESLNQRDGIHPTAAGSRRVADNIWGVLKPLVERQAAR